MTSRERVLLALDHKPVDRLPTDFNALDIIKERLIAKLGVRDEDELLAALEIDMRRVTFGFRQPGSKIDSDGYLRTMWGVRERVEDRGDGLPSTVTPFTEESSVDDVHEHAWPDPDLLDYSVIRANCEAYHDDYVTYGAPWSPFFHDIGYIMGQENFMIWMHTRPDLVHAIVKHVVDYELEVTRRFLEAADGLIDITYFGNDFGTQRGMFISPAMWREFMREPLKRFYDISHDHGCKVMQHSCGAIRAIIPDLIEIGVDILDPVQVACDEMSLAGLMADYGDSLTFHGGVDTQGLLPFGSEKEVRELVRSYIELGQERGGYILAGSQEYIEDIPVENILAIYDENNKAL